MNRSRLRLLLDVAIVALLFVGTNRLFRDSTGMPQSCDSAYSLVVAEKILTANTADVGTNIPADPAIRQRMHGYTPATDLPYQFVRHTDPRQPHDPPAIYYGYPLGSTVLSLPFVQFYLADYNLTMFRADGQPNLEAEAYLQQRIASRIAAATVALFYVLARFFCPPLLALLLALGFGLGSPVWSTLSRSLWSHTWMVFWLTVAIVLLLVAHRRAGSASIPRATAPLPSAAPSHAAKEAQPRSLWVDGIIGAALGTALFAMVFTRPHAILSAGPIGIYLLLHHRRLLLFTVLAGAAWVAGLVAVSYACTGVPMPPTVYQPNTIDGRDVLNRFAWLMLSPSRGLLVFCPYLVVIGGLLFGYRRHLANAALLLPAGLSIGSYLLVFAAYNGWHAGSSYGPRYFSDVIPWFALLGAMAVGALRNSGPRLTVRKALEGTLLVAAFAWAVWVHKRGANVPATWEWNYLAQTATEEGAAKDWHHPQFLAGITFKVRPDGSVEELR